MTTSSMTTPEGFNPSLCFFTSGHVSCASEMDFGLTTLNATVSRAAQVTGKLEVI